MQCLYCGDPVQFRELQIDHIIPARTSVAELERLRLILGLGAEFDLEDPRNLAPAHHDCNRRKANTQFNDAALGFYLGTWAKKQNEVREEILKFERAAERDDALARDLHRAETRGVSHSPDAVRRARPAPRFSAKTAEYDPGQWESARIRHAYVMEAIDLPRSRARAIPAAERVWNRLQQPKSPPNPATVWRWIDRYTRAGDDIAALIDAHEKKGNRTRRHPPEVEDFVRQAIERTYLTPERKTARETLDHAITLVSGENDRRAADNRSPLPQPTRRLVSRLIEAIPAFDRFAARHGHFNAVRKFRRRSIREATAARSEAPGSDPSDCVEV